MHLDSNKRSEKSFDDVVVSASHETIAIKRAKQKRARNRREKEERKTTDKRGGEKEINSREEK